jgi:hypothetical protein
MTRPFPPRRYANLHERDPRSSAGPAAAGASLAELGYAILTFRVTHPKLSQ